MPLRCNVAEDDDDDDDDGILLLSCECVCDCNCCFCTNSTVCRYSLVRSRTSVVIFKEEWSGVNGNKMSVLVISVNALWQHS